MLATLSKLTLSANHMNALPREQLYSEGSGAETRRRRTSPQGSAAASASKTSSYLGRYAGSPFSDPCAASPGIELLHATENFLRNNLTETFLNMSFLRMLEG